MKLKPTLMLTTMAASSLAVTVVTIVVLLLLHHSYQQNLQHQGQALAKILASDPRIIRAVTQSNAGDNTANVQQWIERIRRQTDASYMVVVNQHALRLSHPERQKLGKHFVGYDIYPALRHVSHYSTKAAGTLGEAIRNFASIVNADGAIIGAVCIGYLSKNIADIWFHQYLQLSLIIGVVYVFCLGGMAMFFIKMKRTFFNYEPEYVARQFTEYQLMFDSIRDAIIATDNERMITKINRQAAILLAMGTYSQDAYLQQPLSHFSESLNQRLQDKPEQLQQGEFFIGKLSFSATIYPITAPQGNQGYVVVFYARSSTRETQQSLTYLKNYTEQLRSKTHEYSNKLNVLSGMLQLGHYDECLTFIQEETDPYQTVIHQVITTCQNSAIAGLLLAKFNKAGQMGIAYRIDADSNLSNYPKVTNEHLVTILGNLIDNALFAAWQNRQQLNPEIQLYISDRNRHLMIDVEDNGQGIDHAIITTLLDFGASTKTTGQQHGIGLYLVSQLVNYYQGTLEWERTASNTTLFSVCLPKKDLMHHE